MAVFILTHSTFDRIAAIPVDFPMGDIETLASSVPTYVVSSLAKNHATAYSLSDAFLSDSYADGYVYDRIWVTPVLTEFGILAAEREIDGIIWNTYKTEVTLTAVTETGTNGLELGGVIVPTTLNGLSEYLFTVTASLSGPSTIDATYTFNFDSVSSTISFTGSRSIPFTLRPIIPVAESWKWLTKISTSYDTSEQRIMLRDEPRRTLSHTYQSTNPYESSVLTSGLLGIMGGFYSVPSWHEQKQLLSPVAVGDTEVFLDTRFADFQTGWKAMIWLNSGYTEVIDVSVVNDASLELNTPVKGTFPQDALVLPIHFGVVKDRIQQNVGKISLAKAQVDFIFRDTKAPDTSTYTPLVEYQTYPVLTEKNYIFSDNSTSQDIVRPMVFFDNGQGKFEVENRSHARLNNTLGFYSNHLDKIWSIKTFLAYIKGRLKPFWALTWSKDFFLVGEYLASESLFDVLPNSYSLLFGDSTNRRDVTFVMKSGAMYHRRIIGSTESTITTDSSLGVDFSAKDVEMVCFLNLVRCASDDVNFQWTQAGRVQISIPVVGVDA